MKVIVDGKNVTIELDEYETVSVEVKDQSSVLLEAWFAPEGCDADCHFGLNGAVTKVTNRESSQDGEGHRDDGWGPWGETCPICHCPISDHPADCDGVGGD